MDFLSIEPTQKQAFKNRLIILVTAENLPKICILK